MSPPPSPLVGLSRKMARSEDPFKGSLHIRLLRAKGYVLETTGTGLLFIFLTAWFLQFVSTQELIFAKSCQHLFGHDHKACGELSSDASKSTVDQVQGLANRILLGCVGSWSLPTLVSGPLLTALHDNFSQRLAIATPFAILALAWFMTLSPYWILLSSFVSGLGGTYVATLGLTYAQISHHCRSPQQRSTRFAIHTGFTGLSQCLGFVSVGTMLRCCGFAGSFGWAAAVYGAGLVWALLTIPRGPMQPRASKTSRCVLDSAPSRQSLESAATDLTLVSDSITPPHLASIIAVATGRPIPIYPHHLGQDSKTHKVLEAPSSLSTSSSSLNDVSGPRWSVLGRLKETYWEIPRTLFRRRECFSRAILLLCIGAFFWSYVTVQGSLLTANFYLKQRVGLTAETNGYLEGSRALVGTLTILFLYPLLVRLGASDLGLSALGLVMYLGGRVYLAVVPSQSAVFGLLAFDALVRFPQSGIRSILSGHAEPSEQARILVANSCLQSVASLLASLTFNNLLPLSMGFFPPLIFVLLAVLCVVPIACLALIHNLQSRHRVCQEEKALTRKEHNENPPSDLCPAGRPLRRAHRLPRPHPQPPEPPPRLPGGEGPHPQGTQRENMKSP